MLKKLILGSQFYVYSAYLPIVFSIFTLPIITPYVGLRDYGIYGLVFSIYSFISLFFNLGFAIDYQNCYFNENSNYRSRWSEILGFQVIWNSITSFPFILILAGVLFKELSFKEILAVVLALLPSYLILDPLKDVGSRYLQYNGMHMRLFQVNTVGIILQYSVVLVLIIHFKLGFIGWFIGNLSNSILVAGLLYLHLKKNSISIHFNFSFQKCLVRIRTQTAVILTNLSGYILETSDRLLLTFFKIPMDQIGLYNIAYNYTNYGQTINSALNTVFSPIYLKGIKMESSSSKQMQVMFKFWIQFVFFIAINMIIWGEYIFEFLYRNPALNGAYLFAFPMILALVYRPFYVMVVDNLIIQEKTKMVAIITICGAALNFILNIIFIPTYGITATVYSTAISYLFLGFSGLLHPKIRKQLTEVYFANYLLVLLILCLSFVVVYYVDFKSLILKVSIFSVTALLLVYSNRHLLINYFTKNKNNFT